MTFDISFTIDPLASAIEIGLIIFLYRWAKWERGSEEKRTLVELIKEALDADKTLERENP